MGDPPPLRRAVAVLPRRFDLAQLQVEVEDPLDLLGAGVDLAVDQVADDVPAGDRLGAAASGG
jgi:hypothetical protein